MQIIILLSYTSEVYTRPVFAQEAVEMLVVVAVVLCKQGDEFEREERADRKSNVETPVTLGTN